MLLIDNGRRYEILLPHFFMDRDGELNRIVVEFWSKVGVACGCGNGMWIKVRPA